HGPADGPSPRRPGDRGGDRCLDDWGAFPEDDREGVASSARGALRPRLIRLGGPRSPAEGAYSPRQAAAEWLPKPRRGGAAPRRRGGPPRRGARPPRAPPAESVTAGGSRDSAGEAWSHRGPGKDPAPRWATGPRPDRCEHNPRRPAGNPGAGGRG